MIIYIIIYVYIYIYDKPKANIIFNKEYLRTFFLNQSKNVNFLNFSSINYLKFKLKRIKKENKMRSQKIPV